MEIFLTVGIAPLLDNHLFKLPASLSLSLTLFLLPVLNKKQKTQPVPPFLRAGPRRQDWKLSPPSREAAFVEQCRGNLSVCIWQYVTNLIKLISCVPDPMSMETTLITSTVD